MYNRGAGIVCILDNRTTAMTGHQGNPVNGITLQHRESRELDLARQVRALGVERRCRGEPDGLKATRAALKAAAQNADELSVIIFARCACFFLKTHESALVVSSDCRAAAVHARLSVALLFSRTAKPIVPTYCVGCEQMLSDVRVRLHWQAE